jgi:amidase
MAMEKPGNGALNELSASDIARRITAGATTAEAVVTDCLARIEAREDTVHAWAFLDPDLALGQARAIDARAHKGALAGVPVGVKDIIDTADMPCEMGSEIYRGHRPAADASCVAMLRAAGAVILGKTVTCEFAGPVARETTNPHDPDHTPGGSSSGSAAAVADFMCAAAFGTQTGGSVLRPSSYCGIVGFKPSFGTLNRAGIKFAAESLDTIGLHTRTIDDVELLLQVLAALPPAPPRAAEDGPRIGLCRTQFWDGAAPETREAVEDAARRLAASGCEVRDVTLPGRFHGLTPAREAVNDFERARAMADEWNRHGNLISERMRQSIANGLEMPFEEYVQARRAIEDCVAELGRVFEGLDALLTPTADGAAPAGLDQTGHHRFQSIWTMVRTPAITLPTHAGPNGLPVGIQLVGRPGEDGHLLAAARWVLDRLGPWN